MKTSQSTITKIKQWEGLRLKAYKAVKSERYYTIGYGHYAPHVKANSTISEAQADAYLREDLQRVEQDINSLNLTLTQNQFDALVSFTYNLGIGNLKKSTLLRYIQSPNKTVADIQGQFRRWVYAGTEVLPGLVARRNWEAELWAK